MHKKLLYPIKLINYILISLIIFSACQKTAKNVITEYNEKYRPQFHYTPYKNWMNDPNGLVYFDGEYHMFYQHNPQGRKWGHMSWGHAISPDLVYWQELSVAIPEEDGIMAFSGSAVVDKKNTSGFGKDGKIPLIAIYTGYRVSDKRQFQCLAYSLDRGRSWTKYKNNPVLDIGSTSFRDPHVFWYEPEQKWIMVIALAARRKVAIYSSRNLKKWKHLSNFGPAGESRGIWECPDLFPLAVENITDSTKWVMEVDLGSHSVAGGSGGQYFVGDFNGEKFIPDHSSATKVIDPNEIENASIIQDFEDSNYGTWKITGTAFGDKPARGTFREQDSVRGFQGKYLVNTFFKGDSATGIAVSPKFTISQRYINFLIGGGFYPKKASLNLIIEDSLIYSATGYNTAQLTWENWNVSSYIGKSAHLKIIDSTTLEWGYILIDQIMLNDQKIKSPGKGKDINWVDYGRDFYAAITFANLPESDKDEIWIGWMNNWDYAQKIPTDPWRSAQSIPRRLSLKNIDGEYRLIQQPVKKLQKLRKQSYNFKNDNINDINRKLNKQNIRGKSLEIILECELADSQDIGLKVHKGQDNKTVIGYNHRKRKLYLDRRESGEDSFHKDFSEIHTAPLKLEDNLLKLHIFIDRSSVEIFANKGKRVITDRIFSSPQSDGIEFFSNQPQKPNILSLKIWQLKSIWNMTDNK